MPTTVKKFERIERLPPYILSEVTQKMGQLRQQGKDVINLGMGNPDLPTPKPIVEKLREAALKKTNHRYSVSRGIPKLRMAVCDWYERNYGVKLNFDDEAIATMGAKEGLSHLVMAICQRGDVMLVPNPAYPIHLYSAIIAGADIRGIKLNPLDDFFRNLENSLKNIFPKPKFLIVSFPANPTTQVVDLDFFKELVRFCQKQELMIIHDFAYADLTFDEYKAPSILQVRGAKKIACELYSLSKGYSMPGWRVGFVCGNPHLVKALKRIKSYLDYGMFQPIQIAATVALNSASEYVTEICDTYKSRRDVLCDGLTRAGWQVEKPKATMFVWAKIPEKFQKMGSLKFSKTLLNQTLVCVSPGVGFGEYGEGYVRFALVENEKRIRQAVRNIRKIL